MDALREMVIGRLCLSVNDDRPREVGEYWEAYVAAGLK